MRNFIFVTTLLLCGNVYSDDAAKDQVSQKLVEAIVREGAASSAQVAVLNGVKIESVIAQKLGVGLKKNGDSALMVNLSRPGLFKVGIEIGQGDDTSAGMAVFQKGTGQPYLVLEDDDNDGVFDFLSYSILDKNGEWLGEVEDYGMDGVADFRMYHKEKRAEVHYQGKWLPVKKDGERRFVEIAGKEVELKQVLRELGRPNT